MKSTIEELSEQITEDLDGFLAAGDEELDEQVVYGGLIDAGSTE